MFLTSVSGFLALSLLNHGVLAQNQADVITDDAHFYGQSPPVYPTREFSNTFVLNNTLTPT